MYEVWVKIRTLLSNFLSDIIHKYVKDIYSKRFPELDSLVPVPLDYLKTVKEVGNNISKAKNNAVLQDFLTQAVIMVVSVTASTTQGQDLDKEDLDRVMEACDMVKYSTTIFKSCLFRYLSLCPSFPSTLFLRPHPLPAPVPLSLSLYLSLSHTHSHTLCIKLIYSDIAFSCCPKCVHVALYLLSGYWSH